MKMSYYWVKSVKSGCFFVHSPFFYWIFAGEVAQPTYDIKNGLGKKTYGSRR